jgi:hypothetical protein
MLESDEAFLTTTFEGRRMPDKTVQSSLQVSVVPAPLNEATRLIVEKHYLHRGRTMAQFPYWIIVDGHERGVVLYALPRLSVEFHGYHPMKLIELARLWVDPEVQQLHVTDQNGRRHTSAVAGRAVASSLRRVRSDWELKYPHLPDLEACVAWADLQRHKGTVYRATNFEEVGISGGRLPGGWARPNGGMHRHHADYRNKKIAFIYRWRSERQPRSCPVGRSDRPSDGKQQRLPISLSS